MAHAMATHYARKHNLDLSFESCGIRATRGSATTEDALIVLSHAGINWSGTSQPLGVSQLKWADKVFAMTQEHAQFANDLAQSLPNQNKPSVELLAGNAELVDPLNCGLPAYEQLHTQLKRIIPAQIKALRGTLGA